MLTNLQLGMDGGMGPLCVTRGDSVRGHRVTSKMAHGWNMDVKLVLAADGKISQSRETKAWLPFHVGLPVGCLGFLTSDN